MSVLEEILETSTTLQQFTHVTAGCRIAVHRPEKKDVNIVKEVLLMREGMARHLMMLRFVTTADVVRASQR